MDTNTATIISGLLSMVGGIVGAGGAFWAARHQMNKSKEKDNENRLIDLKVMKLDETISNFNDLKLLINSVDGNVKDINITVEVLKGKGNSHIDYNDINLQFLKSVKNTSDKLESIINKIDTNKWYIKSKIDLDQLYNLRSEYLGVLKKYSVLFSGIEKTSIYIKVFYDKFKICEGNYDSKFQVVNQFAEKAILTLEKEVEKILSDIK